MCLNTFFNIAHAPRCTVSRAHNAEVLYHIALIVRHSLNTTSSGNGLIFSDLKARGHTEFARRKKILTLALATFQNGACEPATVQALKPTLLLQLSLFI